MIVVYNLEKPPESFAKSIFLEGPTPRSAEVQSWRPEALQKLEAMGYDGVVFVPEGRNGTWHGNWPGQVAWEDTSLNMSDIIVFWVPRDMKTLPGLKTNIEFGRWEDSGKIVFGSPDGGPKDLHKTKYMAYYASQNCAPICHKLDTTLEAALAILCDGAQRQGGERDVPLHIWKTSHFQAWYGAQRLAANRLDGARVVWTFRVGPQRKFVFFFALHVDVYITREDRHKTNEVVLARPDIATIVMYRPKIGDLMESEIVLVREFRSPAATEDGFVWEVPGGSSFKDGVDPFNLMAGECKEETSLDIDPARVRQYETRQMVATMSAHRAHLFAVRLDEGEMLYLKDQHGIAHGVEADTERTYVEIRTLRAILERNLVDWSMLGMILRVVHHA